MSCNSAIYTALTTPTVIAAGGTVPIGTLIRRFGRCLSVEGNGIAIGDSGYYDIDASITVLPTAAGAITATVLKDGVAIPGATATGTAAAAGNPVNLSISALIRQFGCCSGQSVITVILSAAGTVNNMAIVAEKV